MRSIGFIDFYLSEWHANNYPAWLSEVNEKNGTDFAVKYAWAEQRISPRDGVTSEEWCAKFGVELCETLEELCEKSDCLLILAPSDPEKHLQYAKTALTYGKPTYIDKTFAPNYAEAEEIFELSARYGTPFFSTSALRYEKALDACADCRHLTVFQSGSSVEEYIIHAVEMVVKKLGIGAHRATCFNCGEQKIFHLCYRDDRSACMVYAPFGLPASMILQGADGTCKTVATGSPIFNDLIADMLRFFDECSVSFDSAETLEAMKIRDAVLAAAAKPETTIEF